MCPPGGVPVAVCPPPDLVEDVVAPLAGGDLDEAVEALRGLLDQHVPAPRVVALPPQPHHLEEGQMETLRARHIAIGKLVSR